MSSGIIKSGDYHLKFSLQGHGKPALVIGSSTFYPRTFSENLRKYLRMAFVDHRGFAACDGKVRRSDFELDVLLADMELTRAMLGLGKVVVIGHSGHGYLALEYAKKYPQNVSHIVVIATGPSHGVHMELAQRAWDEAVCPKRKSRFESDMQLLQADITSDPENRFVHFCIRLGAKGWFDHDYDPSPLWQGVKAHNQMFDYVFGEVFRDIKVEEGLEQVTHPVFLAMGRFDYQVAPHYAWDPYRKYFRDLTLRVFDRSAHIPQMEEPDAFDDELLKWLLIRQATCSLPNRLNPFPN